MRYFSARNCAQPFYGRLFRGPLVVEAVHGHAAFRGPEEGDAPGLGQRRQPLQKKVQFGASHLEDLLVQGLVVLGVA